MLAITKVEMKPDRDMTTGEKFILSVELDATVTFDANGGLPISSKRVVLGNAIGNLPVPTKDHNNFLTWKNENGIVVTAEYIIMFVQTILATWELIKYRVTLDANGGSPNYSRDVGYGTDFGSIPIPTKSDYTFQGYFTATSGGSKLYTTTKIYQNISYYAQWLSDWIYRTGSLMPVTNTASGWNPPNTTTYSSVISNIKPITLYWTITWGSNGQDPMPAYMLIYLHNVNGTTRTLLEYTTPKTKPAKTESGYITINDGQIYNSISVYRNSRFAHCTISVKLTEWYQK